MAEDIPNILKQLSFCLILKSDLILPGNRDMIRNKQNNERFFSNSAHQAVVKPLPQALFPGDWKEEGPSSAHRTMGRYQNDLDKVQEVDRNKMPRALHQDSGRRDHHLLGASGKPSCG